MGRAAARPTGPHERRQSHDQPRSLSELILAYLAERPGQPLKPHEIARGINATLDGHHLGTAAVTNCCLHAAIGRLIQVDEAPMAFAYPAGRPPTGKGSTDQP